MSLKFEDLIKNREKVFGPKVGSIVKGVITEKTSRKKQDCFLVDVGFKSEGVILASDFDTLPKCGDEVDVQVVSYNPDGSLVLSYSGAKREMYLQKLREEMENEKSIEIEISAVVPGGCKVILPGGILAFLPTDKTDLEVGQKLEVYISRIFSSGNIHVSFQKTSKLVIKVGDIVDCIVKNFNDFFVFVEIIGSDLEGIIHCHDISWKRVSCPSGLLTIDQVVKAKVLSVDCNRAVLGIKQTLKNNWVEYIKKLNVNDNVKVKIIEIRSYGLLVEISPNVEGLVHTSEISWGTLNDSLENVFSIGQMIDVLIQNIDMSKNRISLSIKALLPNPFEIFLSKYKEGDIIEGKIVGKSVTYAFVEVVPGVDGILYFEELGWNVEESRTKFSALVVGAKIPVKVIRVRAEEGRIMLSIKQIEEDPFNVAVNEMKLGNHYACSVSHYLDDFIAVRLNDFPKCNAFIKKNDLSRDKYFSPSLFPAGRSLSAKLIRVNREKRSVYLSVKALENDEVRKSMEEYTTVGRSNMSDFIKE